MKLRKLFAWLMTLVMLLGMVPAAHAELAGCNHDWDSGKWLHSSHQLRCNSLGLHGCCRRSDETLLGDDGGKYQGLPGSD